MIALSLAGPAAAWDQHEITHLASPVAIDEHHHHDDEGSVTVLDERSESSHHSQDDDRDGGHDHLPSLFAAMSDVLPEGPVFQVLFFEDDPLVPAPTRVPPDLPPARQIRPPRFA